MTHTKHDPFYGPLYNTLLLLPSIYLGRDMNCRCTDTQMYKKSTFSYSTIYDNKMYYVCSFLHKILQFLKWIFVLDNEALYYTVILLYEQKSLYRHQRGCKSRGIYPIYTMHCIIVIPK